MKNSAIFLICLITFQFSFKTDINPELKIGASIPKPELELVDVSNKSITLTKIKKGKGLLVIFSCNTCPYVKLSEKRIKDLSDFALKNEIGVVLVNSNESQREEEDSFNEMISYHKSQSLNCFYVLDKKSELADAFGATRTPQCFLFNHESVLVYKGAIDDNVKDINAVKQHFLKLALDAVLNKQTPNVQETKSIGCTIKRLD
jgi:thioredoxin-related protein